MVLSKKQITKALIRLCECAGWPAPVLFSDPRTQVFSRRGPIYHSYDRVLIPGYTWQDFVNIDLPFSPYHAAKFYVLHSSQIFIQFIGVATGTSRKPLG